MAFLGLEAQNSNLCLCYHMCYHIHGVFHVCPCFFTRSSSYKMPVILDLEKEMATLSSILTWRMPWTEEPGGLQSMGSQELDTTWRLNHHGLNLGFSRGSAVKNSPAMRETWVRSLGWEDSLEEGNGNPLQYSCLENPHGQRSLVGYSPWGLNESDTTE